MTKPRRRHSKEFKEEAVRSVRRTGDTSNKVANDPDFAGPRPRLPVTNGKRPDPVSEQSDVQTESPPSLQAARRAASDSLKERLRRAGGIAGWGLAVGLALYYISKFAVPYFTVDVETYGSHLWHAGWLLAHIIGGIIALLVGPFLLWSGLHRRYRQVHRWSGRLYLTSVAVSALAAAYLVSLPEQRFGFQIGIGALAIVWVTSTGLAYTAVLRRHFAQHKEWMIRSYVNTFSFVFFRIGYEFLLPLELVSRSEMVDAISWTCWAVPLFVTEVVLQGRKIFRETSPAGSRSPWRRARIVMP